MIRAVLLLGALLALDGPKSEHNRSVKYCADADWLALANVSEVGLEIGAPICPDSARRMAALGFEPTANQTFVHRAKLLAKVPFVLSQSVELPDVDGVAIISIDRRNGQIPYIHSTLRSLLRELPTAVKINVFVGDNYDGYLSDATLTHQLGQSFKERVFVVPTDRATAEFLKSHHDIAARASWNYARALRNYTGTKHLLLFEDDIELSTGALPVLARHLRDTHPPLLSLYNFLCERHLGATPDVFRVRLIQYAARASRLTFGRTQGIAFSADFARDLGDYLSLRLGENPYDTMMHSYMVEHALLLGFVQPSMVQHRGNVTTGLGNFHESSCYLPNYPQN